MECMKLPRTFRTALGAVALVALAALPARGTWSIVAVDTSTGETLVAGATCLNIGLHKWLPVIVSGKGAAAAQSAIDPDGSNLLVIRDGFLDDQDPLHILRLLQQQDPQHQTRQYGIVDFDHAPVSFTGTGAGDGKLSVSGVHGTIKYAIQGNVLTGPAVILAAEQAFLSTDGDLGQRAIAGMEAARLLGGDGRCSCSPNNPTGCGVPPPNFTKSAESSFLIIARVGDADGICSPPGTGMGFGGCAKGPKYLRLWDKNQIVDPVLTLEQLYADWREQMRGVPDHVLTDVTASTLTLPADGKSVSSVEITLRDLNGTRILHGGHKVTVRTVGLPSPATTISRPVTDHGDGTYSFQLRSTGQPGRAEWVIEVDDGTHLVRLFPSLVVTATPAPAAR